MKMIMTPTRVFLAALAAAVLFFAGTAGAQFSRVITVEAATAGDQTISGTVVPFREVVLHPSAGEAPLRLYDTSGAYTDPSVEIDLEAGLPMPRAAWLAGRGLVAVAPRAVRPEDNGFAEGDRLVAPCPGWRCLSRRPPWFRASARRGPAKAAANGRGMARTSSSAGGWRCQRRRRRSSARPAPWAGPAPPRCCG
jgi:hypothetical protein